MGAWSLLVAELEETLMADFDPESRRNEEIIDAAVDSLVPPYTSDQIDLLADNDDILNFDSGQGNTTIAEILEEAISSLLIEEGYRIVAELEGEVVGCEECGNRFMPNDSDAIDPDYCSWTCELNATGNTCNNCDDKYDESDSDADDSASYCSSSCQYENEAVNCDTCGTTFLPNQSAAINSDRYCSDECEEVEEDEE